MVDVCVKRKVLGKWYIISIGTSGEIWNIDCCGEFLISNTFNIGKF